MDSTKATAAKIEAARESAGISRLALSQRTGIARTTLIRKLDGFSSFSVDEIEAISTVLGVEPTALVVFTRAA